MKELQELSLRDVMPENFLQDSNVNAIISALDPELKQVTQSISNEYILSRLDELPENVIDLLAWELHVDFYDLAKTLRMKRDAVRGSLLWHMKKGTRWAIVKALDMIGIDAEVIPWYEYNGIPYAFKVHGVLRDEYYTQMGVDDITNLIRRAVNEAKSARSYLDEIDVDLTFFEPLNITAGLAVGLQGNEKILLPKIESPGDISHMAGIAQGLQGSEIIGIERVSGESIIIPFGLVLAEHREIYLGPDISMIQELLIEFEKRIFAKMESNFKELSMQINNVNTELKSDIAEVKDLLRWADDYEEPAGEGE